MGSRRIVVSPHLDDAVLSCWHLLENANTTVVTVFTALPEPGTSGWWDKLTGADDSRARVRERLAEDQRAMSLTGASSVHLDLLDEQYRRNGAAPPVAEALAEHVEGADAVYAPLGVWLSEDHELVRDATLGLRADVRFYADHPHAAIWGLPSWVTGDGGPPGLDVDAAWRQRMTEAGLNPEALTPAVHPLDDAALERKLAAVNAYATQLAALEREAPLHQLRWEVTWTR
jgi:LmbE family N-acetylglucosaminyl deacetylase